MKNTLFIILTITTLFLFGCSGNKKQQDINYTNENTLFRVHPVELIFSSKCQNDEFPTKEELTNFITEAIKENICSKYKCTTDKASTENVIDINTKIWYRRVFIGEAFKCGGIGGSSFYTFSSSADVGDKTIAIYNQGQELVTMWNPFAVKSGKAELSVLKKLSNNIVEKLLKRVK